MEAPPMRLPLRVKIILPFAVLLVFTGLVGSGLDDGADAMGDRFVFIDATARPVTIDWVGPVRTAGVRLVGAVVVAQPVDEIAALIPGSAFFGLDGSRLAASQSWTPALPG